MATAGRSRAGLTLEARLPYANRDAKAWSRMLDAWEAAGATHISLVTTTCGLAGPEAHIAALRAFAQAVPLKK